MHRFLFVFCLILAAIGLIYGMKSAFSQVVVNNLFRSSGIEVPIANNSAADCRETLANEIIGLTRNQLIEKLGQPQLTKVVERPMTSPGLGPLIFRKGDTEMHYSNKGIIVCIRNNISIGSRIESFGGDGLKRVRYYSADEGQLLLANLIFWNPDE